MDSFICTIPPHVPAICYFLLAVITPFLFICYGYPCDYLVTSGAVNGKSAVKVIDPGSIAAMTFAVEKYVVLPGRTAAFTVQVVQVFFVEEVGVYHRLPSLRKAITSSVSCG